MKLIFLVLCVRAIVSVNCGNCVGDSYLLKETADRYKDWTEKQINNNNASSPNVLPTVNASSVWILNHKHNYVSILAPDKTIYSIYKFQVNSIEIQIGGAAHSSCSSLANVNMNWFRIVYSMMGNSVSFQLPNMEYELTNSSLTLRIAITPFVSSDIKIEFENLTNGSSHCIRFDLIGGLVTEAKIIGYQLTMASSYDLPDYQTEGMVCDRAYNICTGGVSYLVGKSETDVAQMLNPNNHLIWNCKQTTECIINLRFILDYDVKIKKLEITGQLPALKKFLQVRFVPGKKCRTGETTNLGTYGEHQLYKESFDNLKSEISNVFEFFICIKPTESADIYSISLLDKNSHKINFKESCLPDESGKITDNIPAVISVSIVSVLVSVLLIVLSIIFAKTYLQQKKLISKLTREQVSSKWNRMKLPLTPENTQINLAESGYYCEISDGTRLIQSITDTPHPTPNRKESNIRFTDNSILYSNSPTVELTATGSKTFSNIVYNSYQTNLEIIPKEESHSIAADAEDRKDTFSEYSNLKHF